MGICWRKSRGDHDGFNSDFFNPGKGTSCSGGRFWPLPTLRDTIPVSIKLIRRVSKVFSCSDAVVVAMPGLVVWVEL